MSTFVAEMTDTFAGEANYSWVTRREFEAASDATDRQLVTRAKKALGLTGVRCHRQMYGDEITLDVAGACIRIFIYMKI